MILAAGEGRRLLPLTRRVPKPLLRVDGVPLIERHVQRLVAAGVCDLVVNLHHLGHLIRDRLGDGSAFGAAITYSEEETLLETGGGITRVLPLLGEEPFVVVAGDILSDYDFTRLPVLADDDLGHLVMVPNPPGREGGDFSVVGNRLSRRAPDRTYAGLSLLHPALFADSVVEPFPLRDLIFAAAEANRLSGELYEGPWSDMGTPEVVREYGIDVNA